MSSNRYSPSAKTKLTDAQRAWSDYREKVCSADGELTAEGGAQSLLVTADCALQITAQRASQLEEIIHPTTR